LLPGPKTVPEMIAANKFPYYDALDAADAAWRDNIVDVSAMEELLGGLLAASWLVSTVPRRASSTT